MTYQIIVSFIVTYLLLQLFLITRIAKLVLDKPNQRSMHTKLTPRTGGIAIMAGVLIAWVFVTVSWYWIMFPLSLMLVSLIDDISHLSVKWRLFMQLMISAVFVFLVVPPFNYWLLAIAILLITWMTNLYNFMDGSDGLAGGMGLFGFIAYAIAAYFAGSEQLAIMCACISFACLAFLLFNFYPAKIFMGDSGSIPLGFLAGAIGLFGWQQAVWDAWFPFLVFSPFIVDATTTLIKRLFKREKIWQAHKSHYYQKLVQIGWGHRKTALAEYALMFCTVSTAILLMKQGENHIVLGLILWTFVYFVLMRLVDRRWQSFEK